MDFASKICVSKGKKYHKKITHIHKVRNMKTNTNPEGQYTGKDPSRTTDKKQAITPLTLGLCNFQVFISQTKFY
jgi:hypothetical protein